MAVGRHLVLCTVASAHPIPLPQDTLREPPKAATSMRKAISVSMSLCFLLYMLVGCLGYAALGDATPSEILLGFESAPAWVRMLGNAMVFVHLAPAYQVGR